MGLPYSYKSFFKTDISPRNFSIKLEKNHYSGKIKKISESGNQFSFDFDTGFFGISTKIDIEFKTDNSGFYYDFSLINLIKIIIILIIIFAFVLKGVKNLLIIPSISIIAIYSVVIFHIKNLLEDIFEEITKDKLIPETMSEEQKSWQQNPDVCPGCGYSIIEYNHFCPECGLSLSRHRKTKPDPSSRSGFEEYHISYKFYEPKE
jgi:rubredoxin